MYGSKAEMWWLHIPPDMKLLRDDWQRKTQYCSKMIEDGTATLQAIEEARHDEKLAWKKFEFSYTPWLVKAEEAWLEKKRQDRIAHPPKKTVRVSTKARNAARKVK